MPFTTGKENLLQLNRNSFDFNLQFEQLFFSIIPSALFIVTSLWRTLCQFRKPVVVNAPLFQLIKLGAITTYVGLELSLLVLVAVGSFQITTMFIASSILNLVSALFMILLSVLDHSRSPRPSTLLSSYLFLTFLLDATQARTLFLSSDNRIEISYSSIFSAALALKVCILLLEAQEKSRWLDWDEKKHSPEETSGIFSLGVFFWLNRMFLRGYRKVLATEDLYPLDSSFDATSLNEEFSRNMDYSKLKCDKFGLVKVLVRTLKGPLLLPVIPRLAYLAFTFCQPLFLERLSNYLSQPRLDANTGYGFIGASLLIYSGLAISWAFTWYFHHRMRTMATSMLVTEIYKKATTARIGAGDDNAVLTLMSTDMERIKMGLRSLHEIWASIIQAGLAGWMLYTRLGVVFVAPMGVVVICFSGLAILTNFTGDSQRAWMAGVQKRVGLTATVIASMKNLKISGLSAAIGDFVQRLRVEELAAGARFRQLAITAALLAYIPQLMSPPLTFAFTTRTLDATRVFTSLSFLTLLTSPFSQVFQSIPGLVSAIACLGRIQAFLECETHHDFRQVFAKITSETDEVRGNDKSDFDGGLDDLHHVEIKNGWFGWEADKFVLRDVSTRLPTASLTIIVGPVGSGKSTLCKALLGEVPFSKGNVIISTMATHVGFCDQTAFLSNGTIKENIVGFSPFNEARYEEVIDATALKHDIATLPQGDESNIGSDGIALSGGQKQRVSLARALYLHSELLVLDDVFSGLDADTEEEVFRKVFGPDGLLRRRRATVLLCTHSIRHLPAADHIIALGNNSVVEQGSYATLATRQGYVQRLGLTETRKSDVTHEKAPSKRTIRSSKNDVLNRTISITSSLGSNMQQSRQVGDKAVYRHYFKRMGLFVAACSVIFAALWGFFINFATVWLTYWTDDIGSNRPAHSSAYYASIYATFQICCMISLLVTALALLIIAVKRAGAGLHQEALRTLIQAPLQFFTNTDTGIVTNLFSQDLNLIDTELPEATLNTIVCVFEAIGQAAVMLTSSLYLAISYPFLAALLYVVQKFYLRTSRQLRLLDLEAKSPLYTHFLDTLKGITTIRAFGFLTNEVEKNSRLVNSSQQPAYLLLMIQEWLNLVLNLVVMVIAVVLTILAVRLHSNSAFAGASLVSLMSFGDSISGIVIFYTKLETSIGAIARLKAFKETVKPEDTDSENIIPSEQWPQSGIVELKGVSASYGSNPAAENGSNHTPTLALRNIQLSISAGSKVAICGRTGSGKSSLIALLLKLLDPLPETAMNATIDNTPLHRINRPTLRQRIIAVPQEAVFLPDGSTVQANLDPSSVSTSEECQSILTTVGLWDFVQDRGGLNAGMSAGTFSAGQRQLLSLGRALLRRRVRAKKGSDNGILLLDEVSSSVDHETERVMQNIIRTEFRHYTVIAVSHRLDMIMDFDRVVVMDTGEIVEIGNPAELAAQPESRFGDLVRTSAK
ncbi:ABC multidrug transporter [Aspergillus piperis CBS 112811]|uniref:ABC multidrug transporter n=1 Tax=Aspergillus piperis CBS 112811 TaxID=1448313 RepID=A0A8G1QW03_9EURO|nr:ABC multidrug transporter [Aspergillus piperis CBS 112811]RAH55406.1 ABC multidrug transporter [Aspergillus piperis CBS 112811]